MLPLLVAACFSCLKVLRNEYALNFNILGWLPSSCVFWFAFMDKTESPTVELMTQQESLDLLELHKLRKHPVGWHWNTAC